VPSEDLFGRTSPRTSSTRRPARSTPKPATSSTEALKALDAGGLNEIDDLDIDHVTVGPYIRNTLKSTRTRTARTRCSTSTASCARASRRRSNRPKLFNAVLRSERYDLSAVGRVKMNMRLELDAPTPSARCARKTSSPCPQDAVDCATARANRRHRQPRQPPRAFGRRADGKPVSHRPAAHGARDQGAHVVGRYRHRHAARPDQRQAGGRRRARVLRFLAALAVHGPDQPALGNHPQASSLGARPGRSDARARRLRSARRAPDALRPHLPDRNAGRPEHRSDQLAGDLRPRQQVRLHRKPVPQGRRRQA
jgi:hypothetical protein